MSKLDEVLLKGVFRLRCRAGLQILDRVFGTVLVLGLVVTLAYAVSERKRTTA